MPQLVSVLSVASILLATLVVVIVTTPTPSSGAGTSDGTVYHANAAGTGVTTAIRSVATTSPKWCSRALDGALSGESLVSGSDVYVATQNDTVYALSAITGRVLWSRHLARAVPSSALPRGNISPSPGISGTPVVDPARREIFVVADEFLGGHPAHLLVGLNLANGALESNRRVDPPFADASALLQRTGLTLDHASVVVGFGGNYGDCGAYQGHVVTIGESSGGPRFFAIGRTNGNREGAGWMGGAAPVVDAAGHIWVSVGNCSVTSNAQPYDDSDSVLELSPADLLLQFFAPTSWPQDNASDADFSMAPVLLANGQVSFQASHRSSTY